MKETSPGLERVGGSALYSIEAETAVEAELIGYLIETEKRNRALETIVHKAEDRAKKMEQRMIAMSAQLKFQETTRCMLIDVITSMIDRDKDAFTNPNDRYKYAAPFYSRYPYVREFIESTILVKDEDRNTK